ncbi:MAG TPA: glyoxalase/bleomycin resistance/dioxygenase family protein [Lentisphaeria bacterium]|nr:MAG: hypothetical protein A2X45_24780 [Lentisphaerae bacterium GWF2_50_93]HCE46300.1 glyoxalase/bleomycin resistance/dioxygenase family protein [Lentisphaeria bacterium]
MKIEHIGFQVAAPAAMADWYIANLNFSCRRSADEPVPVRFIADSGGKVMLEIYNNPKVEVPDYSQIDPLTLHFAYTCDDIPGTVDKLVKAGAVLISGPEMIPSGDQLAMLRDPWGLVIQLCHRKNPMV